VPVSRWARRYSAAPCSRYNPARASGLPARAASIDAPEPPLAAAALNSDPRMPLAGPTLRFSPGHLGTVTGLSLFVQVVYFQCTDRAVGRAGGKSIRQRLASPADSRDSLQARREGAWPTVPRNVPAAHDLDRRRITRFRHTHLSPPLRRPDSGASATTVLARATPIRPTE
jgi:hypothetical protein